MIEYLEGLLEEGNQEERVLALAEELLSNRANSPREVLALQTALLRAYTRLGIFDRALTPGHAAVELSREQQAWDYFGTACLFVGIAHGALQQYQASCQYFLDFIHNTHHYQNALKYQTPVWYNLGLAYLGLHSTSDASRAFATAIKVSTKEARLDHGIRQALVFQYLRSEELHLVPSLLAQCGYFLRHYDHDPSKKSLQFHIELRTRFALKTQRLGRARAIALRGLHASDGDQRHAAILHLIVAQIGWEDGAVDSALEHALVSRSCARSLNRNDLENAATSFLSKTLDSGP